MNRSGRQSRAWWIALLILGLGGCLYDPDDLCSANQEANDRGLCTCVAGAVPVSATEGCEPCGEHEVVAGEECVCLEGYARAAGGEACVIVPAGLGERCDSGSVPCADEVYDYCRPFEGSEGYCTSTGCASSDDCPTGYVCDEDGATRYCQRPPTGQGAACETSADCAGYEASYCEVFQAHICLVSDCTVSPDSCQEGWTCCDLTSLGLPETLCVEAGLCPTS